MRRLIRYSTKSVFRPNLWLPTTIAGLLTLVGSCGKTPDSTPALLEVPVIEVIQQDVPIFLELVGQTRGSVDIPIRARVEGFLESMDFQEGGRVNQGDLLYTIDNRPFMAKVVEAQGRLAEARTMLAKSKSDLARIRPLAEMQAVSQQDLDAAIAQYEASQGSVQAAEAQLDQAQIELSYTRIASPINGRIGISEAKVGEFVGAEPNPVVLNFVSQTDPIRVRFSINEREYLRFARYLANRNQAILDHKRESHEGLELILSDGNLHSHKGQVIATDAAVDPMTGTFTMEADFPNPNKIVLAGQFARVRGIIEIRRNALLVPQRAVAELQGNFRVYVVANDGSVTLRDVKTGPIIGKLWIIEEGLQAGERVAVEGILRLNTGMKVQTKLIEPTQTPPTTADTSTDMEGAE